MKDKDFVVCKKNYSGGVPTKNNNNDDFVAGRVYWMYLMSTDVYYVFNREKNISCWFYKNRESSNNYIEDYFISKKELRKLKLEKINENR